MPKQQEIKIIIDNDDGIQSEESFPTMPLEKKESWVTYDSGIDLTMKDTTSFECAVAENGELPHGPSERETDNHNEGRFANFLDRYIRMRRRINVPGNLVNTYAVSSLEINTEQLCVVEKVTIV